MQPKSILITGCSSGIGYDAAHALKSRSWQVFATCRKEADCVRLREEGLDSFVLDYTKPDTIDAAVQTCLDRTGGTLDALFNNGAYGTPGLVQDLPTDALREIFETNFFGYHTLTRAVLPAMQSQGQGRIINCSSVLGFVTLPWRGAYNSTKFALEGLTDTMRVEMRGTDIKLILLEPGPITSKIRENSIPHFEKWVDWKSSLRAADYENRLIKRLYESSGPDTFELPASACSKKIIHALEHPNPKPRYYVTKPTYMMGFLRRILPTRALDWVLSKA